VAVKTQTEEELLDSYDAGARGHIRALRGRFRLRSHETGKTSGGSPRSMA
jgi:hypothetical protein